MHTWNTDSELVEKFGVWWVDEMEFGEESTCEQKLATANKELEARGFSERVTATKENPDDLSWVLASEEVEVDFCEIVEAMVLEQYGLADGADLCFNLLEMRVIPEEATVNEAARIVAQHLAQA